MSNYFYGDSNTVGYLAAHPYVSQLMFGDSVNSAVNGHTCFDQASTIYSRLFNENDTVHYLIGTNDQRLYGNSGAKVEAFKQAYMAQLAYMSCGQITTAKSSLISYSGTWTDTSVYGIGKRSNVQGSSASFTIEGDVVYISFIQQDVTYGKCQVLVDGITKENINFTSARAGYGPRLVRISGLGEGTHNISVVVTSTTGSSNVVYLDWFATPVKCATVKAMTVPRMTNSAYSANGGSDWDVINYRQAQIDAIEILKKDGLDVRLIDLFWELHPASDTNDGTHFTDAMHYKIKNMILNS